MYINEMENCSKMGLVALHASEDRDRNGEKLETDKVGDKRPRRNVRGLLRELHQADRSKREFTDNNMKPVERVQ
jgi:hypothetical protein